MQIAYVWQCNGESMDHTGVCHWHTVFIRSFEYRLKDNFEQKCFSEINISNSCIFSSFFLFSKKIPIVVVLDVCPSVCPSVEIISFRGNSLPNRPIELKIGLNVREGVVHVRKA